MSDFAEYNSFNEKLASFINVVISTCPKREQQLTQARNLCGIAVNISPKLPAVWFKKNITSPLSDSIMKKDIDKFIADARVVEETNKNNKMNFSISEVISAEMKGLSDDNKEVLWRYLKVLVLLSNKCEGDPSLEGMC